MERESLQTLSQFSRVLFPNPETAREYSKEQLTLTSLHHLPEQESVERTLQALVKLAETLPHLGIEGSASLQNPFYLLQPLDRFLMCASHVQHWPYLRIRRILGMNNEELEHRLWKIRNHLATSMSPASYAAPSPLKAIDCPEYDPARPWTQRFMDDEIRGQEKLFLQYHLMSCQSCRNVLYRCRDIFYQADRLIPRLETDKALERAIQTLGTAWKKTNRALAERSRTSFLASARKFFRHRDIQLIFALVAILLVYKALHS